MDRWTEYLPLDDLIPAPVNPKRHAVDVLDESMGRHGYIEPVVLDERTGRLIGGHGRVETLTARRDAGEAPPDGVTVDPDGRWLVPVARGWASASDLDADAALVTLNRSTELGGWDLPELGALLGTVVEGPGLAGVGYTPDEVAEMNGVVPDFTPDPGGGQPRLDQRNPVICPNCKHEFHPR